MSETAVSVTRKRTKGIISFKGLMAAIDKAIDGLKDRVDTKKATKQYEEIRKELLSQGIGIAEEKYLEIVKKVDKIKELSENDKIYIDYDVLNGKSKEDGKNRRRAALGIGVTLVEAGFEAVTGESFIATILASFGLTAPPATTIAACALAGATALYSLYKLNKTKKFTRAEKEEAEAKFKESFTPLINDVKKLCAELEKEKANDIASLKTRVDKNNPNAKRVTADVFKKTFAMRAIEIMEKLNLKTLKKDDVAKAFGVEGDIEKLKAKQQEEDAAEAAEIEAREAERARIMYEQEEAKRLKEIEEKKANIERGQE